MSAALDPSAVMYDAAYLLPPMTAGRIKLLEMAAKFDAGEMSHRFASAICRSVEADATRTPDERAAFALAREALAACIEGGAP